MNNPLTSIGQIFGLVPTQGPAPAAPPVPGGGAGSSKLPAGPEGLSSLGAKAEGGPAPRASLPLADKAVSEGKELAAGGTQVGADTTASLFKSIQDSAIEQMKFTTAQGVLQNATKMVEAAAKQTKAIGEGVKSLAP